MTTQPSISIGYLGPEGSNSHSACLRLIDSGWLSATAEKKAVELTPFATMRQTLAAVGQSKVTYGFVPIENSLQGSVVEVMESIGLSRHGLTVYAEALVPIVHGLIQLESPQNGHAPIKTVISHPQALAQCQETLMAAFGESVELKHAASTSEAVRILKATGDPAMAAIGTAAAAKLYDLPVTQPQMSDASGNTTRFLLISNVDQPCPLARKEDTPVKSSLCLGLKDRPGVLVDTLQVLKDHGANLTRIESRPSRKRVGNYVFYLDVDGSLMGEAQAKVMAYLEEASDYVHLTGPYTVLGEI
ncbi:MAG: prephenate dehydratase [Vampirovibrio sp.]|nr:prephenate dehydratase [Vampirovibrio sp.]